MDGTATVSTGIAGLDAVLRGGLPRGRLHLLQGPTGSGKTTLALQFALAGIARGEPAAYVSLAESETEITSIAASHGWSVDGLALFHQGPGESTAVQTVLHPAEVELPAVLESILERVEALRPSRLVVDSLTELRILAREPRWYRHELMRLRARLEALGCTALLLDTAEATQGSESLLGGVLRLQRATPLYGPERRRLHVVKMRGHAFETGLHDFRIRTGGIEVYPRLVAARHRQRFVPGTVSTGLAPLDAMLGGGLDVGTAILLLGATGTGKSTLAIQCAAASAARGEKVLLCMFDERLQTVFQRAAALGIDLERFVDDGLVTIQQVDPAEVTPGEFACQVAQSVSEGGVRLFVVDSLNAYVYAMPEERLLNVHLHELLAYLSQQGVTSLLVAAQHGSGAIPPQLDVSYLADTVVLLRMVAIDGRTRKAVTVYKRRAGAHSDATRELRIADGGLSIGGLLAPLSAGRPDLYQVVAESPEGGSREGSP